MSGILDNILATLAIWLGAVVTALGYPGIVLLSAIGSACIPMPSEIVYPFCGYLVSTGAFTLIGATAAAVLGENIGAAIAYEAGKRGGRPFVERFGRYLFVDLHHLDMAERFFARFGPAAVLVGRLLPLVRAFVALPAGMARMNRVTFHIFTSIGSAIWCFALIWLGMKLGNAWGSDPRLKQIFHSLDVVIVVAVLAVAAWIVWKRIRGVGAR